MATPAQPRPNANLHFQFAPVQIGEQINVLIQIADDAGINFMLTLNQETARVVSRALKQAIEQAEVAIVKPSPRIV